MELPSKPRILIADDDPEARTLIKVLLENAGCDVIGSADDGEELVEMAANSHASIILLDLTMPNMDGFEAMEKIRRFDERTAIIVVSAHENPHLLRQSIVSGANGYLTKLQLSTHLIDAIAAVLMGDFAVADPQLIRNAFTTEKIQSDFPPDLNEKSADALQELTPREQSVLTLIAQGYDNMEIAEELVISYNTVKSHTSNIFNKLDVTDRTQAAVLALKAGLLDAN